MCIFLRNRFVNHARWVEAVRESVLDPEKNAQEKIETFGDLVSQIQAFVKN